MAETTNTKRAQYNPDSLDAAINVLDILKSQAAEAERRGDAFTFGLMHHLVKVVSPIINKAYARKLREEKAEMSRRHQELKANAGGKIPFKNED